MAFFLSVELNFIERDKKFYFNYTKNLDIKTYYLIKKIHLLSYHFKGKLNILNRADLFFEK